MFLGVAVDAHIMLCLIFGCVFVMVFGLLIFRGVIIGWLNVDSLFMWLMCEWHLCGWVGNVL